MDFRNAAEVFDRYVDWERRLAREVPFLARTLERAGARRVADVACGTGMHAIALAREGFRVTGFDPDARLLKEAAERGGQPGPGRAWPRSLKWVRASFAGLSDAAAPGVFQGVLCLGNSLALLPVEELPGALRNMARLLAPGGVLVAHTVHFDALARRGGEPWGPVRRLPGGARTPRSGRRFLRGGGGRRTLGGSGLYLHAVSRASAALIRAARFSSAGCSARTRDAASEAVLRAKPRAVRPATRSAASSEPC